MQFATLQLFGLLSKNRKLKWGVTLSSTSKQAFLDILIQYTPL